MTILLINVESFSSARDLAYAAPGRRYVAGFGGNALTASADLQRRAALRHADAVTKIIRARRSALPSGAVAD